MYKLEDAYRKKDEAGELLTKERILRPGLPFCGGEGMLELYHADLFFLWGYRGLMWQITPWYRPDNSRLVLFWKRSKVQLC